MTPLGEWLIFGTLGALVLVYIVSMWVYWYKAAQRAENERKRLAHALREARKDAEQWHDAAEHLAASVERSRYAS